MAENVLDASAVLAVINGEPGADRVAAVLSTAAISCVNLSEVVAKLADMNLSADMIENVLGELQIEAVELDTPLAHRAGMLRPLTRSAGLSLGDRACIALAQQEIARAFTADSAWRGMDLGIEIVFIRP